MLCYLDATGEALAGMLRPGNAGANTAADHIGVLCDALEQLPEAVREDEQTRILVRADTAGCTHEFLDAVVEMECSFSVGYELTESVRQAILALPESAWRPAVRQDGEQREGAWVAELQGVDLSGWPAGARLICRRERPHPGAQFTFTDHEGHRFQAVMTNQAGDAVALEARHRARARVEDRIRAAKDTGLRNLPFRDLAPNTVWLELVLMAQDLIAWTQHLLLDGELARLEPKRLRYRLLHVAGRITRSGRRLRLHLPAEWPWAEALVAAFRRLRALPSPTGGRSRWIGESRALGLLLCRAMRSVLCGEADPPGLSRRATKYLGVLREEFAWLPPDRTAIERTPEGEVRWWTFAGVGANRVLSEALGDASDPTGTDNLTVRLTLSLRGRWPRGSGRGSGNRRRRSPRRCPTT